ncbi:MAG: hypothetical protein GAK30_02925 [Paracidovorax wautersii]|uniref:Xylose isomerase-like TIM barrel domain-containing protein n=1 Tax=Paracidovorax wautersii TaxID=1177982 RepID=A0A7V8FM33_9BURK|nr:MAG: hypothetical protein GAK30_02925 [Paracidovorax wautersii]
MISDFCVDLASLHGSLAQRLEAVKAAGFHSTVAQAATLVGELDARGTLDLRGVTLTALHARIDYEGLQGPLHAHKLGVAQSLLRLCQRLGCPLLVLDASTLSVSSNTIGSIVADLRKLSMLAIVLGVKVAWRAHPGAAHARDFMVAADVIQLAERPNLGLSLDVQEWLDPEADLAQLDGIDAQSLLQVQLADTFSPLSPAQTLNGEQRLFPGEGLHAPALRALMARLGQVGYRGHFAFADVRGDGAVQPNADVMARAERSASHLALDVLRRSQPLTLHRRRAGAIPSVG